MRGFAVEAPREHAATTAATQLRAHDWLALLGIALAALAFAACDSTGAASRDHFVLQDLEVGAVARLELDLDGKATIVLQARKPRFGVRPILHLWDDAAQREVARASASWLSTSAVLSYRNPHATQRRYTLVVRAGQDRSVGRVDLLRDGHMLLRNVELRETERDVASGPGFTHQAASVPRGATKPWLYGLSAHGALVAIGAPSNVLGMPRLSSAHGITRVVVAAGDGSAKRGKVNLYANDRDDRDGDGLGRALERALGTCDGLAEPGCAHSPLARYYEQVSHGTRDTDRDGIDDAAELFGVDTSASLDLPRYGADPRHKDVFVEVDYRSKLGATRLSEQDMLAIAALFARGQPNHLKNPDAKPGVRLHLDVGFASQDRRVTSLFGDWGGSSAVADGSYTAARQANMDAARRGYFRYALADAGGTGQSRADAFTFNVYQHRSRYFAHELGHTLGLAHHGERSFGVANCKPNYQSIMNYAYQNDDAIGFSSWTAHAANPARMLEVGALRGLRGAMLAESPFEFDVIGRNVDWNRDGMIEAHPVRAGVTWATYKSCAAAEHGRQALWQGDAQDATPVIVRTGTRLHVLWVDLAGRVMSRDGAFAGTNDKGSCLLADGDDAGCSEFSVPRVVLESHVVKHIAATTLDDQRLVLITTGADDQVRVHVMDGTDSAQPPGTTPAIEIAQAQSEHSPTVAWMKVDAAYYGAERVLAVLWRAADGGALMQAVAARPEGPWVVRQVLDAAGQAITVGSAPSLAALGTGELCGVFPDADSFIRFYCYVPAQDAWLDLSARAFYAGLGPATSGQVGIAYHRYRYADGTAIDAAHARGAVYLSFTERNSHIEPDNPKFLVSAWLSTQRRARDGIDFCWRGMLIDQWTNLAPHTGVALYEDEELSALKAVMAMRSVKGGQTSVTFLPLADGAQDIALGSGNDFQVMERGICRGIKPEAWCGERTTAAY